MKTEKERRKQLKDVEGGRKFLPPGRGMNIGYCIALKWVLGKKLERFEELREWELAIKG